MSTISEELLLEGLYTTRDAGREKSVQHILNAQSFSSPDILLLSVQLALKSGGTNLKMLFLLRAREIHNFDKSAKFLSDCDSNKIDILQKSNENIE